MGERDVLSGGPAWNTWHPSPEEEPPYRVCGQRASELETHGTTWNVTAITLLIWDPDPAVGGQHNGLFSLQEQEFRIWLGGAEWAVDGDEGAASSWQACWPRGRGLRRLPASLQLHHI